MSTITLTLDHGSLAPAELLRSTGETHTFSGPTAGQDAHDAASVGDLLVLRGVHPSLNISRNNLSIDLRQATFTGQVSIGAFPQTANAGLTLHLQGGVCKGRVVLIKQGGTGGHRILWENPQISQGGYLELYAIGITNTQADQLVVRGGTIERFYFNQNNGDPGQHSRLACYDSNLGGHATQPLFSGIVNPLSSVGLYDCRVTVGTGGWNSTTLNSTGATGTFVFKAKAEATAALPSSLVNLLGNGLRIIRNLDPWADFSAENVYPVGQEGSTPTPTTLYQFMTDGDSLEGKGEGSNQADNDGGGDPSNPAEFGGQTYRWSIYLRDSLPATYGDFRNYGKSGQTVAQMLTDYQTQILPLRDATTYPTRQILFVGGGVNSICQPPFTTAQQLYDQKKQYIQAAKAAGWKVVTATLTPFSNPQQLDLSTATAVAAQYNTLVRNGQADMGYDGLIDWAADSVLSNLNSGAYRDGLHFTDMGNQRKALVAKPIVEGVAATGKVVFSAPNTSYIVSAEGTSRVADERPRYYGDGYGPISGYANPWLKRTQTAFTGNSEFSGFYNYATSGDDLGSTRQGGSVEMDEIASTFPSNGRAICLLHPYINDVHIAVGNNPSQSASQIAEDIKPRIANQINGLKSRATAKGTDLRIVYFTEPSTNPGGWTAQQRTLAQDALVLLRTWLRANYQSLGILVLCDLASDSRFFGVDTPATSPLYVSEKNGTEFVHYSSTGHQYIADTFAGPALLKASANQATIIEVAATPTPDPDTVPSLSYTDPSYLVALFAGNAKSTNTTWEDSSSYNRDATVVGWSLAGSGSSRVYNTGASGGYATLPTLSNAEDSYLICAGVESTAGQSFFFDAFSDGNGNRLALAYEAWTVFNGSTKGPVHPANAGKEVITAILLAGTNQAQIYINGRAFGDSFTYTPAPLKGTIIAGAASDNQAGARVLGNYWSLVVKRISGPVSDEERYAIETDVACGLVAINKEDPYTNSIFVDPSFEQPVQEGTDNTAETKRWAYHNSTTGQDHSMVTISGGKAIYTNANGLSGAIGQKITMVPGQRYKISVDVASWTSGKLWILNDGPGNDGGVAGFIFRQGTSVVANYLVFTAANASTNLYLSGYDGGNGVVNACVLEPTNEPEGSGI